MAPFVHRLTRVGLRLAGLAALACLAQAYLHPGLRKALVYAGLGGC